MASLASATVAVDRQREARAQQREAKAQEREAILQRDQAVSLVLASASLDVADSNGALALAFAAEGAAASPSGSRQSMDALIRARQNFAAAHGSRSVTR